MIDAKSLTAARVRTLPDTEDTDALVAEVVLKYFVRGPSSDAHPGYERCHEIHYTDGDGGPGLPYRNPAGWGDGAGRVCYVPRYSLEPRQARRALNEYLRSVLHRPDHHWTLFRFTTGWRFGLETPYAADSADQFRRFAAARTEALAVCRGLLLHAAGFWPEEAGGRS